MQREISNKVFLGNTVSPLDDIGRSSAINRTVSNYNDSKEKVKKVRELISTGRYDKDIAKYIPNLLELRFQGMLEDLDTRQKVAHSSYTDMEELDFQILLTDNYIINPNSIYICFPFKIKKTNQNLDIDTDLITVNNFFAHFVEEISITKYGSDKELIPTFCPYEIYPYSDSMLKHLPAETLKTIEKTFLYSKTPVYYTDVNIDRRNHNGNGLATTGLNTAQITTLKKKFANDLNIDDRITKFQNIIKNEHVYRIPLRYFTDLGKINFPTKIDYRIKLYLETEMKKLFQSKKVQASGTAISAQDAKITFIKWPLFSTSRYC